MVAERVRFFQVECTCASGEILVYSGCAAGVAVKDGEAGVGEEGAGLGVADVDGDGIIGGATLRLG